MPSVRYPIEAAFRLLKYNEADEEWVEFGGQEGTYTEYDEELDKVVTYFASSPCPTCGGTQGYFESDGTTHHWCGYNSDIPVICGDCHSPITANNPSLESLGENAEMAPHIKSMREAKGIKQHHPSGCLQCLEQHRISGKLPYTKEQQLMGYEYNPDVHWRQEDLPEGPDDFTASSDPFDAGWGAIQKWDTEQWQEEVDLERLMRERGMSGGEDVQVTPPAETDIEPDVDMGNDPCCGEAREMWRDELAEAWGERYTNDPEGGVWILESYDAMSCEEFRQSLEGRFDGQGYSVVQHPGGSNRRNPPREGMNPNSPRSNYTWEDFLARRVLDAWDGCSEERLPVTPGSGTGDDDLGFYASADPFEAGWDAVLKHIGPDNFQYHRTLIPHQTYSGLLDRRMGVGAGLGIEGHLPINEAIRHIESSPTLEDYARGEHYYETAEDLGINRDDFDSDDEYYETLAEMGVADEDPRDYLHYRGDVNVGHIDQLNDMVRQQAGRPFTAEEVRTNMEGLGEDWRKQYAALSRDPMLGFLDELRDSGRKRTGVASGSIGATGMGPMIDVNPLYQGQGLGQSVLAALLENTGRLAESRSSPGGLATMQALSRQMNAQDIPHDLRIDDIVHRPVQSTDWRSSDARYPHQGYQEMSIPEGTTLLPKQPTTTIPITQTLSGMQEGGSPLTMAQMRELVSRAQRELRLSQNAPPSLRQAQPHEIPAWLNEIDWGDN